MSQLQERALKANAHVAVKGRHVHSSCDINFLIMSSLLKEPSDQACIFLCWNLRTQVVALRGKAGSLPLRSASQRDHVVVPALGKPPIPSGTAGQHHHHHHQPPSPCQRRRCSAWGDEFQPVSWGAKWPVSLPEEPEAHYGKLFWYSCWKSSPNNTFDNHTWSHS